LVASVFRGARTATLIHITMKITDKQLDILQHAIGADQFGRTQAARNYFVTDGNCDDGWECQALVAAGWMKDCGTQEWAGGMTLYRVTDAGRAAVAANSKSPPKLTASARRYQAFLSEDSGLTFHEWLACQKHRAKG